jgi:hypothetical protein
MADVAFFSSYGETSRVVGFFTEPAEWVAHHIFDLYRRHAAAVCRVFDNATAEYASALRERSLNASCLLFLVLSNRDPETERRIRYTMIREACRRLCPSPDGDQSRKTICRP